MKFQPFPVIESERLFLRKIIESDSEAMLFLRSEKTVNKYNDTPEEKKIKSLSDAIKWVKKVDEYIEKNEGILWGITFKNDPRLIGTIGIGNFSNENKTAEVGFELDPKFHSKGIMSETLKKIIDFGFIELKLDKIEAITHTENESAKKLLDRNGFSLNENRKDQDNKSTIFYELEKDKS
ncbi:MAG: GNAT family N-acetyltransferase [Candidatus Delongbacteria bacterium]|jgi:ribosomal-protein-alanine N-acetyltransferase|nr:GNAT family N-acetyltransferase [Candidatus Delongbacteria bacterium]